MNTPLKTKIYMLSVLIVGFVSLVTAVYYLPSEKLDFYFLILFCFTIGFGSRMTLEIPRFKSHIAVSDTFIFLALLLYGGEIAIVLAAGTTVAARSTDAWIRAAFRIRFLIEYLNSDLVCQSSAAICLIKLSSIARAVYEHSNANQNLYDDHTHHRFCVSRDSIFLPAI